MDTPEARSPLINDYKLKYLFQVIAQTFLGGLRLRFPFKLPWFVYGIQILIWSFPFIIGSLITLICELSASINKDITAVIYGLLMLICALVCNLVLLKAKRSADGVKKVTNNFLMEEDEVELTACFSLDTIEFIIAKKRYFLNVIFHPLVYGVTCTFSMLFLLPRNTEIYFGSKAGSFVYYFVGWFVVCVAVYPLIGKPPKEANIFRFNDNFELCSLTRAFYVLLATISSYILGKLGICTSIQLAIFSLFICFPILWSFGFFPTINVLASWSAEQILVHCLGGSNMATDLRLMVMFLLSLVSITTLYFIPHKLAMVISCTVFGVVLSADICSNVFRCVNKLSCRPLEISNGTASITRNYSNKEFILLFISILLSGIAPALIGNYGSGVDNRTVLDFCGYVLIVLIGLYQTLKGLQQVFVIFGCVLNPLFSVVNGSKVAQNIVNYISAGLESYILPVFLVSLGTFIIEVDNITQSFINVLLIARLFRKIWQNTLCSSHDFLVFIIIRWLNFDNHTWKGISSPVQMFIISLAVYWLKAFIKKSWFVLLLMCSSKTLKGDQRKVNGSIALSLCFLPVLILLICVSVVLSAPLLPLFTLPVFILGFPRPLRTWPDAHSPTKSSSIDWIYYEQLTPSLVEELKVLLSPCGLHKPQVGSYFLARFQDRLIWISVLEAGLFYYMVTVKGLELQETSCHTTEAESIDEVFNVDVNEKTPQFNRNIMHIMELKTVLQMRVYSDAKNILTGIIDNPEYSDELSKQFPRVLTWVLLKYSKHRRELGIEDIPEEAKTVSPDSVGHFQKSETAMTTITTMTRLSENIRPTTNNSLYTPCKERCSFRNDPRVAPLNTCYPSGNKENDSDDEFGDFGFSDNESTSTEDDDDDETSFGDTNRNTIIHLAGGDSKYLDPPSQWLMNLPYNEADLMLVSSSFSKDWYQSVIVSICDENIIDDILKDLKLAQNYKLLVMNCYYLIEKAEMKGSGARKGPSHFVDMFHGKLPWSPHSAWIEEHKSLRCLVVQAYRLAFKLVYDSFVLGESLEDEDMIAALHDHEENWFLGENESEGWINNVADEKPNLFTIGHDGNGTFTSRMLTLQTLAVPIATVNEECVRGFWSALSLELYYMTNDDEERYSIQALPQLLRNIVTQAADPPLGYPVFSSGLVRVSMR